MRYFNRFLLGAILIGSPLHAPSDDTDADQVPPAPAEANQSPQKLSGEYLNEFLKFKSHIDSLLFALKHIFDETHQPIPFEQIESKSRLQVGQAETLYRKGNHFAGRYLMDLTYREVQEHVIQSRDGSTLTQQREPGDQYDVKSGELKSDRDFEILDASIDALTQALDRVAAEKNMQHSTSIVQNNVTMIRARAVRLKNLNDAPGAIETLRKAYALTRTTLSALRDGDTLTMSLDFATSKEEYEYYLGKNESQHMILSMLAELNPGTRTSKQLQQLIESVDPLLLEAGNLAAANDYESAVPIMDKVYFRLQSGLMMALSSR